MEEKKAEKPRGILRKQKRRGSLELLGYRLGAGAPTALRPLLLLLVPLLLEKEEDEGKPSLHQLLLLLLPESVRDARGES